MKIITIGSATLDVYLLSKAFKLVKSKRFLTGMGSCLTLGSKNAVADIFVDTGGGATNAAVTFANLGISVSCLTRVGDDLFGREVQRVLKEKKVKMDLLQIDKTRPTSYSTLLMISSGQRSILAYRGASNFIEMPEKVSADWFYITSLGGNLKLLDKIFDFAAKNKIKIAWNPGSGELKLGLEKLQKYIARAAVFNVNREEAAQLCRVKYEEMNVMIKKLSGVASHVVITDGGAGAFVLYNNELWFAASLGTKPVSTTGAGDAFGSGFCAGLALKHDVDYALRLAILNSDGVIREMGAKNGLLEKLPSEEDLKKVKIKKEAV